MIVECVICWILIFLFLMCIVATQIYMCHMIINNNQSNIPSEYQENVTMTNTSPVLVDPIQTYDVNKLLNPLEEPTRRVNRNWLIPLSYSQMFNYPTHGYADTPHYVGILIRAKKDIDDKSQNIDDPNNRIIKLFGFETYPNSSQYSYYATINMGNDQIKIPIHNHGHNEFFGGDIIDIPELGEKYEVKLNKVDELVYNPQL